MIDLKSIECDCGTIFTISPELNSISHEHFQECVKNDWKYREAIFGQEGNSTIVKCPECGKVAMRIN